ncbi:MAG: hypothetical protein PHC51_13720, partial [bacterium]|nr:hypothetical protein [bacterium]
MKPKRLNPKKRICHVDNKGWVSLVFPSVDNACFAQILDIIIKSTTILYMLCIMWGGYLSIHYLKQNNMSHKLLSAINPINIFTISAIGLLICFIGIIAVVYIPYLYSTIRNTYFKFENNSKFYNIRNDFYIFTLMFIIPLAAESYHEIKDYTIIISIVSAALLGLMSSASGTVKENTSYSYLWLYTKHSFLMIIPILLLLLSYIFIYPV